MEKIEIHRATPLKPKPDPHSLGFGKFFTDHMFIMDYSADIGWHNARIVPFENLSIHPASTVLHYGSEIFEGLKAYKTPSGDVQLFRPMENIKRMNNSAKRICLPTLDEEFVLHILETFVHTERDWVPSLPGTSLYLRPFMFGNDESLGVHSVSNATFVVIASPVGSYYKEGINPVSIMIESEDVRAVRGGTGYAKCGGNYAASNRAAEMAAQKGYSQVLWLDGVERKYIEEVGAMNVMFRLGDTVVTPALSGSILPGITRMSCIQLLTSMGIKVEERSICVDEVIHGLESGLLTEAWGCGTAAVISPIGTLSYKGKEYAINNGDIGQITGNLYNMLTGIQWGTLPDEFEWTYKINI